MVASLKAKINKYFRVIMFIEKKSFPFDNIASTIEQDITLAHLFLDVYSNSVLYNTAPMIQLNEKPFNSF